MFFESVVKMFNSTCHSFNDSKFDKVDPKVVKYFRIEYGKDWKSALEYHLYKKSIKYNKRVA